MNAHKGSTYQMLGLLFAHCIILPTSHDTTMLHSRVGRADSASDSKAAVFWPYEQNKRRETDVEREEI